MSVSHQVLAATPGLEDLAMKAPSRLPIFIACPGCHDWQRDSYAMMVDSNIPRMDYSWYMSIILKVFFSTHVDEEHYIYY